MPVRAWRRSRYWLRRLQNRRSRFMKPSLVVDVGNSRIKWGRCADGSASIAAVASLPPEDPEAWQRQFNEWGLGHGENWLVSGVHPERRDRLIEWLRERAG